MTIANGRSYRGELRGRAEHGHHVLDVTASRVDAHEQLVSNLRRGIALTHQLKHFTLSSRKRWLRQILGCHHRTLSNRCEQLGQRRVLRQHLLNPMLLGEAMKARGGVSGEHHDPYVDPLFTDLVRTLESGHPDELVVDHQDVWLQRQQHLVTGLERGSYTNAGKVIGARESEAESLAKGAVIIENSDPAHHRYLLFSTKCSSPSSSAATNCKILRNFGAACRSPRGFVAGPAETAHSHMDRFMQAAIDEAQLGWDEGGIPIGSVLVHEDEIIGRGHNRRVQLTSPTLHGEMDALERAGRLSAHVYQSSTIYTTLSPCSMCSGAILLYGIPRVVIGENQTFMGEEELLRSRGVEVIVLDDKTCIAMMERMIDERPDLWNEDIGV